MKTLLLAIVITLAGTAAWAQCQPDTSIWPNDVDPNNAPQEEVVNDNVDALPDMVGGQTYNLDLKFVFCKRVQVPVVGARTITQVVVSSIFGLPSGIDYALVSGNPADNINTFPDTLTPIGNFSHGPFGCAAITGTVPTSGVTVDATDSVTVGVVVTAFVNTGITIIQQTDTAIYRAKYINTQSASENLAQAISLSVAPNPMTTASAVQFTLGQPANVAIRVLDLNGRVVFEQPEALQPAGFQRVLLPYTELANGVYTVQLTVDGQATYARLLK
jgi:hypothetical protein